MTLVDLGHSAAELGSGYGSEDLVGALRAGQLTKRLAALGALIGESGEACPRDVEKSGFTDAYRALVGLQQAHPEVVKGLLEYPNTGVWLAHCLRRIRSGEISDDHWWTDLGYLGWLTAAAMLKLGVPASVPVVVRAGRVMLPTFGLAEVAGVEASGLGVFHVRGGEAIAIEFQGATMDIVDLASQESAGWRPLRRISAKGTGPEVVVDDLDPFRDMKNPTFSGADDNPLPRLSDEQVGNWRAAFAEAWVLLERDHPAYAKPISVGLRSLVPLSAEPVVPSTSYTSYDAFGCIAATSARSGNQMALTLIHEFQHAKLGAFTDFVELYADDDAERFYAPWRDDPRPIEWLLQGMYAHLGVTDFWRVERTRSRAKSELAHVEFARWRTQVERSIAEILGSGLLTTHGTEFVQAAAETLAPWLDEPVPDSAARIAEETASGHWVAWCVRNLQTEDCVLKSLLSDWNSARPPRLGNIAPSLPVRPDRRAHRLRSRLLPSYLRVLQQAAPGNSAGTRDLAPGDVAYGSGDYTAAIAQYTHEIESDPLLPQPWAGLALAMQRLHPDHEIAALLERAEVVAQLYARLCVTEAGCAPMDLVRWLSTGARAS